MALDADTGKVVWEYKFNIFQSDVPPHRVGWASPAADPETGNIYALSGGAQVDRAQPRRQAALAAVVRRRVRRVHHARRPDDVAARRRRPGDRQRGGLELGHARRRARTASSRSTSAPATSSTSSNPGGRPVRHGLRGAAHRHDQRHAAAHRRPRRRRRPRHQAADRREGLELRRRQARHQHRRRRQAATPSSSRTATRTSTGNELGLIAAIDGSQTGDIKTTKWALKGDRVRLLVAAHRRHAPLSDRQRLDAEGVRPRDRARSSGRSRSAPSQKAPPVLADGKIYVGTESGKFFIVRPQRRPRARS